MDIIGNSLSLMIAMTVVNLLLMLIVMLFAGLWTYHDAKAKSEQSPFMWAFVAAFVPNFLGFVVYLALGRTKKEEPAPGSFKIPLICSFVAWVVSLAVLVVISMIFTFNALNVAEHENILLNDLGAAAGRQGNFTLVDARGLRIDFFGNVWSGAFRDLNASSENGEWHIRMGEGDGFLQFSPQLTLEELRNLSVSGTADGEVILQLEQNGVEQKIAVATAVNGGTAAVGSMDISKFVSGRFRLRMYFERAENVDLVVSWNGS
ncbi:MAG: hypothetical protein FWG68_00595 [Defluviitaleaceae bacterium]|nr:hypothetical protein [Defluviitaleaceae bacterium]